MPREVFLAPGGSPFIHSTNNNEPPASANTSLSDFSPSYFRTVPDNLNSSRALAGLEDISTDMIDDDSPMRFRSSVSDELLMGVKGGEFLADDSAMGFDTSLVAKPFDSRPKLAQSTSIPAAVSEEPEEEKPKWKKLTRSRSKSPSKKSLAVDPVADVGTSFPSEPIKAVVENSEPELQPEPEAKPRRTSPRKARTTRPPSSTEAPPAFSLAQSNPFSSPPVVDSPSASTPTAEPVEVGAQAPQSTKPKRTSRTTGRSKSKTRSKNVPAEIDEEPQAESTPTTTAPVEAERSSPAVDQRSSPPVSTQPPAFTNNYLDLAPPHTRTESAPASAPFKFQTQGLVGKSRSKSLTPPVSSSNPIIPAVSPPPETPTLDAPTTPSIDELVPREPTKEEEAEAVASALRILRRDSSIFPRLRQSIAPIPEPEPVSPQDSAPTPIHETKEDAVQPQTEPTHKRTRVGRASTRPRGGASTAGRTKMNQVVEEAQVEESPKPVEAIAEAENQVDEAEPEAREDIAVPVNFGSRTPSPVPAPAAIEVAPQPEPEPEPEIQNTVSTAKPGRAPRTRSSTAPNSSLPPTGAKARATRASLPTQPTRASAPATRAARMSEGRPTALAGIRSTKPKEPELVEEKEEEEPTAEPVSVPIELAEEISAPTPEPPVEEVAQPAGILSPIALSEPIPPLEASAEPEAEPEAEPTLERIQEQEPEQGPKETSPAPTSTKPSTQRKALGIAGKGAPQRAPAATSQRTASKTGVRVLSGQRTASATQKPPSKTATAAPPVARVAAVTARKPSPATQKPPSSGPTRVAVSQEAKAGPAKSKAGTGARPTRTLPKRTSAGSREPAPVETESEEPAVPANNVVAESKDQVMEEPVKEASPEPVKVGPFEHKRPAFQPILARPDSSSDLSSISDTSPPRPNKRRASPEVEPEQSVLDSPSKRVRFSAELEAGPTPRAGPSQMKPKPSIKPFGKPSFQLKASRPKSKPKSKPKRTLMRSGAVPSYAAPLKRNASENMEIETAELERPPLSESQANTRSAANKLKPTVPVEFTFRSELRMKPSVEIPLPNAIPIALPMPDFVAAHAAAEAANLARRERAQDMFLAAQAELEAFRGSKYEIGSETARRAAERAVFDAAMRVKEAEAERLRVEQKRIDDEREAVEIKEMRKRMVPKANPVPEWYKHIGENENGADAVEA